jgi:hypothetical protein
MCNGVRWSDEAAGSINIVMKVRICDILTRISAAFKFCSALGVVAQNLE